MQHGGKGKKRAWVGMGISDREWSGEREGRSASPQRQKVETAVCVGAARERLWTASRMGSIHWKRRAYVPGS